MQKNVNTCSLADLIDYGIRLGYEYDFIKSALLNDGVYSYYGQCYYKEQFEEGKNQEDFEFEVYDKDVIKLFKYIFEYEQIDHFFSLN